VAPPWQEVALGVFRLEVPGGWIYRVYEYENLTQSPWIRLSQMQLVFVPKPLSSVGGES
jgi:hypothetical protein